MNLSQLFALWKASCPDHILFNGVSIDSRKTSSGEVFFALKGTTYDGHQYIDQAIAKGAVAVIGETLPKDISVPHIEVQDTQMALAQMAIYYRKQMSCPVIAVTGSNGKTTVKEMIASILPQPSFATRGNLNNHLGVPLSILQLRETDKFAVFELGANHIGEIAHTVAMVKPQVALINNIGPAHIAEFGSIERIAQAKGEIYQGLVKDGTAVINQDDVFADTWSTELQGKKRLFFSRHEATDVYAKDIHINDHGCATFVLCLPSGCADIHLKVPGEHMVSNALAAAASTFALGIDLAVISRGLNEFSGVSGRMTFLKGKAQATIIDDSYNANLRSTLSAIEVLARLKGRRILVFGDMGELGEWAVNHHQQVGEAASEKGIDFVFTCGVLSQNTSNAFGTPHHHYTDQHALVTALIPLLDAKTTVLVKGSRLSKMENVVRQITE